MSFDGLLLGILSSEKAVLVWQVEKVQVYLELVEMMFLFRLIKGDSGTAKSGTRPCSQLVQYMNFHESCSSVWLPRALPNLTVDNSHLHDTCWNCLVFETSCWESIFLASSQLLWSSK